MNAAQGWLASTIFGFALGGLGFSVLVQVLGSWIFWYVTGA